MSHSKIPYILGSMVLLLLQSGCGIGTQESVPAPDFSTQSFKGLFSLTGAITLQMQVKANANLELFTDSDCQTSTTATLTAPELNTGVMLPQKEQARVAYSARLKSITGSKSPCTSQGLKYTNIGWTWIGGSSSTPLPANYGVLGVPAATNYPSPRSFPNAWIDSQGKYRIFGGNGAGWGDLNDVWVYDPSTQFWTWVSGSAVAESAGNYGVLGVSSPTNLPPSRAANPYWIGKDNNLYVYGGYTTSPVGNGSSLADMWMYNPTENVWTWVGGSQSKNLAAVYGTEGTPAGTNTPGARFVSFNWSDSSGNFWLYGGTAPTGHTGDLWKFDMTQGQWTWMGGTSTINANTPAATLGTESATLFPGGREEGCSWQDSSGNVYLFGGMGYGSAGTTNGFLNDLWRYNPSTQGWTWLSGSSTINAAAVYGTLGSFAATNTPNARRMSACWSDSMGRLWMFGGVGAEGEFNDMWVFDPTTTQWAWVSGPNTPNGLGTYGTEGTFGFANIPGARNDLTGTVTPSGDLLMFGGNGYTSSGSIVKLNDMWLLPVP